MRVNYFCEAGVYYRHLKDSSEKEADEAVHKIVRQDSTDLSHAVLIIALPEHPGKSRHTALELVNHWNRPALNVIAGRWSYYLER